VITIENTDPPAHITTLPRVTMFSGNPHSGRYGFFPPPGKPVGESGQDTPEDSPSPENSGDEKKTQE
jgi:hypothetical protein